MKDPNLEKLAAVARHLERVGVPCVFVGGATIGLYLDEFGAGQVRATLDVDCIVPIESRVAYSALEERLRQSGFAHSMMPGDPICRWLMDGITVDIMPFEEGVLGFSNRFYRIGFATAERRVLADGCVVHVLTPALAFATKVEAFSNRGALDPIASEDLEDLIALLDGHRGLVEAIESADQEIRSACKSWARAFLDRLDAEDLIDAHLPRGPMAEQRAGRIGSYLRRLANQR